MSAQAVGSEATTYVPEGSDLAKVVDFVAALAGRGMAVPVPRPALVDADGSRLELPEPLQGRLRDRDGGSGKKPWLANGLFGTQ